MRLFSAYVTVRSNDKATTSMYYGMVRTTGVDMTPEAAKDMALETAKIEAKARFRENYGTGCHIFDSEVEQKWFEPEDSVVLTMAEVNVRHDE